MSSVDDNSDHNLSGDDDDGSNSVDDQEKNTSDQEEENHEGEEDDDEEDEDEDEDDEEDDEKDASGSSKRKRQNSKEARKPKKKRALVSRFIEEEADVDDDDEEEEEDFEQFYGDERVEAEQEAELIEKQQQFHQQRMNLDGETAEEIVNRIKKRHQKSRKRYEGEDANLDEVQTEVAQQSLLPSIADPKLWIFKCKPGREQHLVLSMMNKFIDFADRGQPLQIKSVVASSSKGYIYVESERESHAKEAVNGLRDISSWSMKLVPIHEMTATLSIESRRKPLLAGAWARMKRAGLYKGDLCKVLEVLDSGTRAFVKLIPRLDASALSGQGAREYTKGQKPPPKLFNSNMVQGGELSRRRHPLTGEMYDFFDNEWYQDGFLHKELNIKTMLQTEEVVPTLEEIQRFSNTGEDGENGSGLKLEIDDDASQAWNKTVDLAKGDTVRVVDGDLVNLMGVVVAINSASDTVQVMPLHEEIRDTILDFQTKQLIKYVKIGDHIKVVSGRYSGETGTVVSIDDNDGAPIAIVLADSMAKEIQVRVRDVQESAEICTGLDSLKGKEIYDLVSLSQGDVGVITHVGRDNFQVLLQNGQSRSISDQEIQRKLQSNRSIALDRAQNQIAMGDMVNVVDGPHSGQTGTIKHLYRSFVFLHNNGMAKDAGMFVVKARGVITAGNKRKGMNQGPAVAPHRNQAQQQGRRGPGNNDRSSEMMGKTVKIKIGRWKGYLGMVVEETEQKVKVEIHCKNASCMVDKQHIGVVGNRTGAIHDNPHTSATPMLGGATPMQSRTPLHSGSMTPMHTPMHQGSSTPSTPHTPGEAWNPASNPSLMSKDFDTPFGASYGTPLEPITPAAHEARTPGAFYQPTTPGTLPYSSSSANLAATPGMGYNPTTPGAHFGTPMAVTPGAFAQTPHSPGGLGGMTPTPMTPNADYSSAPTDMPFDAASSETVSWASSGVEVRVIARGDYEGIVGVIGTVQGAVCTVQSGDKSLRIGTDGLQPVTPEKHNRVKVISGPEVGQTGSLIGSDGDDGIVKMDGTAEIKIFILSTLVKLVN